MTDFPEALMLFSLIVLLAYLVRCFTTKPPQRLMPPLPASCLALLLLELLAWACNVSFKDGVANLIAVALGLLAYCVLFVASRSIPQRWVRNALGFIMFAPIGLGLLFSPVLLVLSLMIVDDLADSGHDTVARNQHYACRTFDSHGILATSYSVRLYRHLQFMPFIEHRVAEKWGDLDEPVQVSCDDVVAEIIQMHPEMAGQLRSEQPDTPH